MEERIRIRGAREHNLANVDLDIPRNQLVVITGLSGSGKSSLAFDTIYAEGQRRYMESLSAYARQFIGSMERPDVDFIDGLSPVIAIEQKTVSRNPRSTVGTVTEIYDFLRLLYARAGTPYSYLSGKPMRRQSDDEIIDGIMSFPPETKLLLLAPVVRARKGHYRELFEQVRRQGYDRVRVDGDVLFVEEDMKVDRYKTHDIEVVVDRIVVREGIRSRVAESVAAALDLSGGSLIAAKWSTDEPMEDRVFSRFLYNAEDQLSYDEPSPNTFSFNTPYGACPACDGLGTRTEIDPDLVIPDRHRSIAEGGIVPLGKPRDIWVFSQLRAVAEAYGFDFDTPFAALTPETQRIILEGAGDEIFNITYRYKSREVKYEHRYSGVLAHIQHTWDTTQSGAQRRWAESFMRDRPCTACEGARLKPEALAYKIGPYGIADLVRMDLNQLSEIMASLKLEGRAGKIAEPVIKEIRERLSFLTDVGVGYLNLDRPARTLSGGESQRIRLATQIGTQLVGVLYVLDEPSIGLHARDNERLIHALKALRDLGNTVIVVEHDREMIEAADFVIDLGPGAGEHGGHVMGADVPTQLKATSDKGIALTAAYLDNTRYIAAPTQRRRGSGLSMLLEGASGHNLKGMPLEIPLGTFVAVTGVSGSGKSSLINQTLYPLLSNHYHGTRMSALPHERLTGLEHADKVIDIDQSPIGRTPRSNPATYTGLFSHIRDLFTELPESKMSGYKAGRFSFNVKGGRCETCKGAGIVRLEMNFLPDVFVVCETCRGRRYNPETLTVRFKGKSIADVLNMTVSEALVFFEHVPRIERKLRTLRAVGLGYIRLGQQATRLSGGEAQRVKLAKELSRPGTGKTVYILDEPTTGLHFEDVRHLIIVLQALVNRGNTVIVIEHNLDVVKVADHVIDLGPSGGASGGSILFAGTPEALSESQTETARFLRVELERTHGLKPLDDALLEIDAIMSPSLEPDESEDDGDEAALDASEEILA